MIGIWAVLLSPVGVDAQNTFPSTGNVGIGTMSPSSPLHVFNNNNANPSLSYGAAAGTILNNGGVDLAFGTANASPFESWIQARTLASAANALSINPLGGNVGIGTMSPAVKLQIAGSGTAPSLSSETGIFNVSGSPSQELAIGADSNSPFDMWLQGKRSWNDGTYWPLSLNPLGGNVGIGTTSPQAKLEINGNLRFTADGSVQTTAWTGVLCGGDYAEAVTPTGGTKSYEAGDVLVLASDTVGNVEKSHEAYSTLVAGIYATKPGVIGRRQSLTKDADELPMAMVGIVPTKVTTEGRSIRQGDLLVTSSKVGYAMKGTDRNRMLGAVIGKAMGALQSGDGMIEVPVTLQ